MTTDRAVAQARRADAEIARGRYRGPLHGIPWGAKDIIAVKGYRTTWGAEPFKEQIIDHDATVVDRLDEAGAVLIAKLSTGELAFGDNWFGGRTNNPWDVNEGASGSSTGSAAAAAAGLVGFAIGTDTGGSILSPSIRCGVVGLRPTFGRVSRYGVMAAGYSLDKIGPITRAVEDGALILNAIVGPDGKDLSVPYDVPFSWDAQRPLAKMRVGFVAADFDAEKDAESKANGLKALDVMRSLKCELIPVELPASDLNYFIEYVERAAGFEEFARARQDAGLRRQHHRAELRYSHLVPAVEYLQANRIRMLLMQQVARAMATIDVIVAPYASINPLTSQTGHPVVAVPSGFSRKGTPTGITFVGHIYKEADLLAVARGYQNATDFHTKRPPIG
jgi:Asp-tRNA(Asn)/Glu-tRNA(Gln) amidotransferase A subunit family amidase